MPTNPMYSTAKPQARQTIGTTAVLLPSVSSREVWLTADDANTGKIFIGDATATTAGAGNIQWKLQAGTIIGPLYLNNPALFFAVGSAAAQILYVGVLA